MHLPKISLEKVKDAAALSKLVIKDHGDFTPDDIEQMITALTSMVKPADPREAALVDDVAAAAPTVLKATSLVMATTKVGRAHKFIDSLRGHRNVPGLVFEIADILSQQRSEIEDIGGSFQAEWEQFCADYMLKEPANVSTAPAAVA